MISWPGIHNDTINKVLFHINYISGIISAFSCQCVEEEIFHLFLSMLHKGKLLQFVVELGVCTEFFFWFLICGGNRRFLG